MDRRELLRLITLATGSALIGSEFLLSGCSNEEKNAAVATLSAEEIAFLDEVGETILPATGSPGAKAAEVGKFINVMVRDCYEEKDRLTLRNGIPAINQACRSMHGKTFLEASAAEREQLLIAIDKEAKENQQKKMPAHYFTMMKQLVMIGFFTSKPGATQALRHVAVPGRYDGAMAYKKGDKAWSSK